MSSSLDQQTILTILREIDSRLNEGVLPVHSGHLEHLGEGGILDQLVYLKKLGLISGDLVTKGLNGTPHRMTNIRLTFVGIRAMRSA